MSTEQITWTPIDSPIAALPPVNVKFEVPANVAIPSDIQLRRFEEICKRFPILWRAAMDGLQNKFNEVGEGQQAPDDVLSAGVFIPELDNEENDENFGSV